MRTHGGGECKCAFRADQPCGLRLATGNGQRAIRFQVRITLRFSRQIKLRCNPGIPLERRASRLPNRSQIWQTQRHGAPLGRCRHDRACQVQQRVRDIQLQRFTRRLRRELCIQLDRRRRQQIGRFTRQAHTIRRHDQMQQIRHTGLPVLARERCFQRAHSRPGGGQSVHL